MVPQDKRILALTGGIELLSEAAIAKLSRLGAPIDTTIRFGEPPEPIELGMPGRTRGPRMTRAEAKRQNRAMWRK